MSRAPEESVDPSYYQHHDMNGTLRIIQAFLYLFFFVVAIVCSRQCRHVTVDDYRHWTIIDE